jgi:hypothetical protein
LLGTYGANEWFHDVAVAGKRAGELTVNSWMAVFPQFLNLVVNVPFQTIKGVSEVFVVPDFGVTWNKDQYLTNSAGRISAIVRTLGQDRKKVLVEVLDSENLHQKAKTGNDPYTWKLVDGGVDVFGVELNIV